jgi:hypothetical protein
MLSKAEGIAHTAVFTSMVLPDYLEQYKKWILKESSIAGESKPVEFQVKTPPGNLKYVIVTGVSYKKAGLIYKFME